MTSIRAKLSTGILYTAITSYSNILISIIITSILARILSPNEFGLVAVVAIFTTFFSILSDFGIGPAIIQNKNLDETDISSIFAISILLGIGLSIIFFLIGPLISTFYRNSAFTNISKWIALSIVFFSASIVPQALNQKKLWFKKIGILSISVRLISGTIAIVMAYKGFSYYSLVAKIIFDSFFLFLGHFALSPITLTLKVKWSSFSKIAKFSTFQFLFNFINYFSRNMDNILIGKYMGILQLGLYDKSYQLMMMPVSNLTNVITPVLQPILSDYEHNKAFLFNSYLKVVKILAIIGFPLSVFLYFSGAEIIMLIYGNQWRESIPIFKILSLTIGIQMVLSSSGSIFQAANRTDLFFLSGLLSSVTMVTAICFGIFIGRNFESVGYSLIIAFTINFFQGFYILISKVLNNSLLLFFKTLLVPILLALTLSLFFIFINLHIKNHTFINLLIKLSILITPIYLLIKSSNNAT